MKECPVFFGRNRKQARTSDPFIFPASTRERDGRIVWLFVDLPDVFLADPNVARFVRFSIRRFISGLRVAEKHDLSLVRMWLRTSFEQELGR